MTDEVKKSDIETIDKTRGSTFFTEVVKYPSGNGVTGRMVAMNGSTDSFAIDKMKSVYNLYFKKAKRTKDTILAMATNSEVKKLIRELSEVVSGSKKETKVEILSLTELTVKKESVKDFNMTVKEKNKELSLDYTKEELEAIIHVLGVVEKQKI